MQGNRLRILAQTIENSVRERGATPEAVWLDRENVHEKGVRRCDAIFRMIGGRERFTLLDLGCGPGLALGYLEDRYGNVAQGYCGVDVSELLVAEARRLHPGYRFLERDIIAEPLADCAYDFTAINGVLTAKYSLAQEAMEEFAMALLEAAWNATAVAMSFNVMSPHVDWTRNDLFHWPLDRAVGFSVAKLSRHVNVLADYGLYEYTVQVFREPRQAGPIPPAWAGRQAAGAVLQAAERDTGHE